MLVSHTHPTALFHAPCPFGGKALSAVHTIYTVCKFTCFPEISYTWGALILRIGGSPLDEPRRCWQPKGLRADSQSRMRRTSHK